MSEAIKPTPGPWWVDEHGGLRHGVAHARDTVPVMGVALLSGNVSERVRQAEANRDLLFEAGTVFHETGLSPRQLAERNAELVEALLLVRDYVVTMKGKGHEYQIALDAALAKCQPKEATP